MRKKILITVIALLLTGGGFAFAEYTPQGDYLGVNAEVAENESAAESVYEKEVHKALSGNEDITPDHGKDFGAAVSERARDKDIDLGEEVSEAARETAGADNNDEIGNKRSDVAEAVHEELTGGKYTPEGGSDFGQAAADRARDKDIDLGEEVSEAAKEVNNTRSSDNTPDKSSPPGSSGGNPGNSGDNPGNSGGSPGNSGR